VIIYLGPVLPQASSDQPGKRAGHSLLSLFGLAPDGVYQASNVTIRAGALLPHLFTITCALFRAIGCVFSVALSVGSRPLGVTQRPALRSSDFPREAAFTAFAITWPACLFSS